MSLPTALVLTQSVRTRLARADVRVCGQHGGGHSRTSGQVLGGFRSRASEADGGFDRYRVDVEGLNLVACPHGLLGRGLPMSPSPMKPILFAMRSISEQVSMPPVRPCKLNRWRRISHTHKLVLLDDPVG